MGWAYRFHPFVTHQSFALAATSFGWRLAERYDPLAHPVRLWYYRRIRAHIGYKLRRTGTTQPRSAVMLDRQKPNERYGIIPS